MTDKLFGALSLCRKAGKLKLGMDVACEALAKKQCALLLFSGDLSPRSARKAQQAAQQANIQTRTLPYAMEQLTSITGKEYGIMAVCDHHFAQMIKNQIDQMPISDTDSLRQ